MIIPPSCPASLTLLGLFALPLPVESGCELLILGQRFLEFPAYSTAISTHGTRADFYHSAPLLEFQIRSNRQSFRATPARIPELQVAVLLSCIDSRRGFKTLKQEYTKFCANKMRTATPEGFGYRIIVNGTDNLK